MSAPGRLLSVSHLIPCHFLLAVKGCCISPSRLPLLAEGRGSPCLRCQRGLKTSTWQEISKQLEEKRCDRISAAEDVLLPSLSSLVFGKLHRTVCTFLMRFSACNVLHLVEEEMVAKNRIPENFSRIFTLEKDTSVLIGGSCKLWVKKKIPQCNQAFFSFEGPSKRRHFSSYQTWFLCSRLLSNS